MKKISPFYYLPWLLVFRICLSKYTRLKAVFSQLTALGALAAVYMCAPMGKSTFGSVCGFTYVCFISMGFFLMEPMHMCVSGCWQVCERPSSAVSMMLIAFFVPCETQASTTALYCQKLVETPAFWDLCNWSGRDNELVSLGDQAQK